ncbi:uncharacterized protein LOC117890638 [Drosophila subobscura]|uniref:uncharacterized protein LOC117890638 n=1 Tax=Drosophila subobscura TaxID=7241 RepID=UPI00155A1941|nr:uncharacterized protein LOC117890638 [Drosophila subobscura]
MCWSVSRQSKCYAIAICAYFYGLLDIAVKVYCLAYDGFKPFIVVGLSAWLPILLAATLLFLGASQASSRDTLLSPLTPVSIATGAACAHSHLDLIDCTWWLSVD